MTHKGIKIALKIAALAIVLPQVGAAAPSPVMPEVVTSVKCGNECDSADVVLTGRASTPTPDPCEEAHKTVDLHASISVLTGDRRHVEWRVRNGGPLGNRLATSRNLAGTFLSISSWVWNRFMAVQLSKRD